MCISLPTIRGMHFTDLVRCMQSMFVSNFVIFQLTILEKHSIWLEPHGSSALDFSVYHTAKSFKASRVNFFCKVGGHSRFASFCWCFLLFLFGVFEEIRIILWKKILQCRFWLWEFCNVGDFANYFLWDQTKCSILSFMLYLELFETRAVWMYQLGWNSLLCCVMRSSMFNC